LTCEDHGDGGGDDDDDDNDYDAYHTFSQSVILASNSSAPARYRAGGERAGRERQRRTSLSSSSKGEGLNAIELGFGAEKCAGEVGGGACGGVQGGVCLGWVVQEIR